MAIGGLLVSCLGPAPRFARLAAPSSAPLGNPSAEVQRGDTPAPAAPSQHAPPKAPAALPAEASPADAPLDGPLLPPPPAPEPEAEQPSDAALERDVRALLIRDPLTANEDIEVDVSAGIATLTGRVDSLAIAQAAEERAAEVPGVGFVYNSISLYPPPVTYVPPPADTDAAIADRIEARLGIDPHDPTPGALRVEVEDGIAILTGTARSLLEQHHIMAEAYAAGAVRVINQMSLVPLVLDPSGRL